MGEEPKALKPAIFAVKTVIGRERSVADTFSAHAQNYNLPVEAILAPTGLRGYVFVEALGRTTAEQLRSGIKYVKGLVKGEVTLSELEHFLISKPVVVGMEVGNIVELTSGPFKGERARIARINETKEEVTIELLEAMVPIPITVRGDHVKVVQKGEER